MKAGQENSEIKNGGRTSGQGLNILMVDDDDVCLFIQQRVLQLAKHNGIVQQAGNGKIALELLHRAAADSLPLPDIILLDLQMPIMNGTQFMEAFQCLDFPGKEHIAIVLLTSSVWERDKDSALSLGIRHCLAKPFTVDGFHSLVDLLYNQSKPLPAITTVLHHQEIKNLRNGL